MTPPAARGPAKRAARPRATPPPLGDATALSAGVPLGKNGPWHPPLGLGLWSVGRWEPADEVRTRAAIGRAFERGLRWFDTAEVYGSGRSERLLGDALAAKPPAPPPFVVTKVSWEHLRPNQVRAALTGSLQRLGRRSVDLFLVHAPDPRVPIAETMPALEALWKEGRVGAIGVSNFGLAELEAAREALQEAPLAVNQIRYNLFDRDDATPIRDFCRRHGILLEAYTPLLRGLLAGRYLDGARAPPEVRRFTHRLLDDESLPGVLARARRIRDVAKEAGVPMAAVALHWLREQGAAPLFGASSPEQVDAIVDAFTGPPPSSEVLARADRIALGDPDA